MKKLILILILLSSSAKAQGWEIISTIPVPVKGAQAVVHDTSIYIIGGFSDSLLTGTKIIQAYYPNSNQWKILNDSLVIPRYRLSANVYNNKAYIFGGAATSNDSSYAIESWDFLTKPEIHKFDFNFNRRLSTSVVNGDYLYIFGGVPDFNLYDSLLYCIQYHIPSGEVVDTFSINDSYNYDNIPSVQMSAIADNQIYIFGGVFNGILTEINTFGLDNKQWKTEPVSLNGKRAGGAAVAIEQGNRIMLIGGFNESSPAINSVEIFNYSFNHSVEGYSLNIERAECAAAVYNESVFVFGGEDLNGDIVSSVEKINPPFEAVTTIGEKNKSILLRDFENFHNYPNPFNPSTVISFKMNKPSHIEINIFDITGKFVKSIVNQAYKPGNFKFIWDGKNESQNPVSSGIYFYKISSQNQQETKRMILVR